MVAEEATFRSSARVETQARCCDDAASPQQSVIYGEDNTNGRARHRAAEAAKKGCGEEGAKSAVAK